jgi:hypothetical protein
MKYKHNKGLDHIGSGSYNSSPLQQGKSLQGNQVLTGAALAAGKKV